jgi:hypothetical protein
MMHRVERAKRNEIRAINDTLDGNFWAGGEGYGGGTKISNLLYDNGAKGGKTSSKRNAERIVVGYGRKNPNIARKKV